MKILFYLEKEEACLGIKLLNEVKKEEEQIQSFLKKRDEQFYSFFSFSWIFFN